MSNGRRVQAAEGDHGRRAGRRFKANIAVAVARRRVAVSVHIAAGKEAHAPALDRHGTRTARAADLTHGSPRKVAGNHHRSGHGL